MTSQQARGSAGKDACSTCPNGTQHLDEVRINMGREKLPLNSTWWSRRTDLERGLFIALLLVAAIAVLMVAAVVLLTAGRNLQPTENEGPRLAAHQQKICLTQECVKTAGNLIDAMDQSVNPCMDFFQYACGGWNRRHAIPDDRSSISRFADLWIQLQTQIRGLLSSRVEETEPIATRKAKYLYDSCLNMNVIRDRGDEPLRQFLGELGGWPVLGNWDSTSFDLEKLLATLKLYSNRVLVNMWVGADDKNSTNNIILLDQAPLGLPSREYFLRGIEEKTLQAYGTFARDVAILLGANESIADQQMKEMVEFEVQLANITIPADQRRDTEALYHKMKIKDLPVNISSKFNWKRYLDMLFQNVSMSVTEDEPVVVYAPDYLKNVMDLAETTPNRTIANYAVWRIVYNRVSNLHEPFLDLRRQFNKALYGTETDRARWRTCISYTNSNFGMAVGRLFVSKYFKESARTMAVEMIQKIREAFNLLLDEVPWMDDATRLVAREKADAIQEKIGYPEYIMNNTALDKDYLELQIGRELYFENVLNIIHDDAKESIKHLREPVDRSKWSTTPAVVNAFYSATKNQIMFPAGILQPPFYHESYPKYLIFGGIGIAVAHEIIHGFDDEGRQFDKDGNLKQWWSDSVITKFKEKAKCIVDQYGNFTVPEVNMKLNGRQTQGENIADNGGLKQAFRAYRRYIDVERKGVEEDSLPGLQLTHNQLFFLNFAQIWCGTARPESYVQSIRSGRHSPGRFRVIGSVSNSKEFADAYNCPLDSPMNPKEKCSVW